MEERFEANPAGRTIVSSFGFRWGITVGSKLSEHPTEVRERFRRAYQWDRSDDDEDCETNCFYQKIVSRFVLKILTADIPKPRLRSSDASSAIPIERHRAIIAVNQREPVAFANNY
jgi:hypothetical protein